MKRKFLFTMIVMALSVVFISCDKEGDDEKKTEEVKATISFTSDDITLDLGSTDANLLAFATASDGSALTVSGVNYEMIGEQNATFKTGDVIAQKKVKVSCKKLAGLYQIAIKDDAKTYRQGTCEVKMVAYNQLEIKGVSEWFGTTEIIATFEDGEFNIPTIVAPVPYVDKSETIENFSTSFSNMTFEKSGNIYKLVAVDVLNYGKGIENMEFSLTFDKK